MAGQPRRQFFPTVLDDLLSLLGGLHFVAKHGRYFFVIAQVQVLKFACCGERRGQRLQVPLLTLLALMTNTPQASFARGLPFELVRSCMDGRKVAGEEEEYRKGGDVVPLLFFLSERGV